MTEELQQAEISPTRATSRIFAGNRLALTAAVVLAGMILLATLGRFLVGDPLAQSLGDRLLPPSWLEGGSPEYFLGTDHLGRDLLSRVVHGAGISLIVAMVALALSGMLGVVVGLLAGYYGGFRDDLVMRIVDVQLAIPYVLLAITLVALLTPSVGSVVLVLLLYGWVIYARLVRGEVLSLREEEFVMASKGLGGSDLRILATHLLPNLVTPIVIISTLELANLIIIESALGFLGLGIPPPTPTWGRMLADGRTLLTTGVWWVAVVPGVAIILTVLSINIVGDWMRDRFDPRSDG